MQCPECRSETPGSLGRCTRCDAVLPQADEASPWSSAPTGNDPWPPEPWQPEPVRQGWQAGPPQDDRPWSDQPQENPPGGQPPDRPWGAPQESPWSDQPVDRPWSGQQQDRPWSEQPADRTWVDRPDDRPWSEQPDDRAWGEQPGDRSWNEQPQRPWSEQPGEARPWDADPGAQQWGGGQQPWSPAPEQQAPSRNDGEQWLPDEGPRWRGPLIAGLVTALLTAAVVVGYVFWTKEDDGSTPPISQPGTSQLPTGTPADEEGGPGTQDTPAGSGDPQEQAEAVDSLLGDMSGSRKKLANITYTCANKDQDVAAFETAVEERGKQLTAAEGLSLSSLDNGDEAKQALLDALQASIDSNQEALTWLSDEDGCDQDAAARLEDVNDKATDTKRVFLDLWNPIATEQGLQTWTRENI